MNPNEWKDKSKQGQKIGIAVCSGGMDSTAMGLAMLEDGYSVIFCHGDLAQKAETPEHDAVKDIVEYLKNKGKDVDYFFADLSWLGKLGGSSLTDNVPVPLGVDSLVESENIEANLIEPGLWTPARNVVLLSVAASLADRIHAHKITWGANQSETAYLDNTIEFGKLFEDMLGMGTLVHPEVTAPLYELDKPHILKWYIDHGYYDVLKYTWSCDEGNIKGNKRIPCGQCGCCMNRRFSFFVLNNYLNVNAQFKDPQTYIDSKYFYEIFIPELLERYTPEMWHYPYVEKMKKEGYKL